MHNTVTSKRHSRCPKYESSPIFVKKLEIILSPDFLDTQTRTFGPQTCVLKIKINAQHNALSKALKQDLE